MSQLANERGKKIHELDEKTYALRRDIEYLKTAVLKRDIRIKELKTDSKIVGVILIVTGVMFSLIGLFADDIAKKLQLNYDPQFGIIQIFLFIYGVFIFLSSSFVWRSGK